MLQKLKTWDFAAKFLTRQKRIQRMHKIGTPSYKTSMSELGVWTREQLVDLGPTFIKLGQLASTRRDLYTPEFIEELQTLQDQVPPIPEDVVVDILDNELSSNVFSFFDTKPFKSASLGQVHLANLSNGKSVVVKVQRPNITQIVDTDVKNIIEVLTFLDALGIETGPSAKEIFVEATAYLYRELDYINEAQNAIRFYNNFKGTSWVCVPRIYSKILTGKILVMERVDGIKITEIKERRISASKALVNSFLTQLMVHGFFHADPHPGNVAVNEKGQLVYYDFGLMVELQTDMRERLLEIIPLIIQKDTRKIVDILIDMKLIVPTADKSDIVQFLDAAIEFLERMDGKEFNAKMAQDELSNSLAEQKPFQIPSDFLFLAKSFTTIDGICQQLDPNFNFIDYIEPMVDEIPESIDFSGITRASIEMPSRIRSINESINELERSRSKLRRSIEKSREDARFMQYSILTAILAEHFVDKPPLFVTFSVMTLLFLFTSQRTRQ